MTLEEALNVLGLPREATPKEVRAAYLRLIKQYGPEQDPLGFRRVRDAFEFARLRVVEPRLSASNAESNSDGNSSAQLNDEEPPVDEWLQHLHTGQLKEAVPLILRSLEYAARFPASSTLPGNVVLAAIAELASAGEGALAGQLTAAARTWVDVLSSPRDAFPYGGQLRWVLLDELAKAQSGLSLATYSALGTVLEGDDEARGIARLRHQGEHAREAMADYEHLVLKAPTLAGAFGHLLQFRKDFNRWAARIVWLIFCVPGLLGLCTRHLPKMESVPTLQGSQASSSSPNSTAGDVIDAAERQRVQRAISFLVKRSLDYEDTPFALVKAVSDAFSRGNCPEMETALTKLAATSANFSPGARAALDTLRSAQARQCPG